MHSGIDEPLRYAGLWRRLAAFLIDWAAYLPLMTLAYLGARTSHYFQVYFLVFAAAFILFYNVYLVRRFAGTPGNKPNGDRGR